MKMLKKFTQVALLLLAVSFSNTALAQDEVSGLIKSSPDDIAKLTYAYLKPLFKGLGTGLNSGWNYSGHSKNLGRFELRVGISGALIPSGDKTFDVATLGLSNNIRPIGSNTIAPTVAGNGNTGPKMGIYYSGRQVSEFNLPEGADLPIIPAPQLQASVGLPKGIELTLRAIPSIKLGSDAGSIGMFGVGGKVELIPLFAPKVVEKVAKKVSPVDLALAIGYTQLNYELPLEVTSPDGSPTDPNQKIQAKFSGINAEVIVSKKLAFFTPFASVGYQTAKTNVDLKGNYRLISGVNGLGQPTYTTFKDPVSIDKKDIGGLRGNIGFQLNLAFFRIFAAYSIAEYNSFNAGIGFGIGK